MLVRRTPRLAAALAILASTVAAQDTVSLDTPASVANTLRLEGYRAKIYALDTGQPAILSGSGGTVFDIQFVGCENQEACSGLLFTASFNLDGGIGLDAINRWNAENYIGRAFVSAECDPTVDYFLALTPEVTVPDFVELVARWDLALAEFRAFVGFDDDTPRAVADCGAADAI